MPSCIFAFICCREQERREERQRMRKETGGVMDPLDEEGSFDDGDPFTTNLYIGQHHCCPWTIFLCKFDICCSTKHDSLHFFEISW